MKVHSLECEQHLARPPAEAFEFFGDVRNLEAITPPWLGFRIVTPEPVEMTAGTLLEYRLRLHGVPVGWRTRIEQWRPPLRFVDVQLSGPYRLWHHTHSFEPEGEGTLMRDSVRYALPLGPLGELAHAALVRRDLERIFTFRKQRVSELLSQDFNK